MNLDVDKLQKKYLEFMGPQEEMPTVKMHKTNSLKRMIGEDVLIDFENEWNS